MNDLTRRTFLSTGMALAIPACPPRPLVPVTPSPMRKYSAPPKLTPEHKQKGRHRVYVGVVPVDFHPTSPADIPNGFLRFEYTGVKHSLTAASRVAHRFNRHQMANGTPGRLWAVALFCAREDTSAKREVTP